MAYAELTSPLPNLTVSPFGCHSCGMRGLGDDIVPVDTTYTDPGVDLTPPPDFTPPPIDLGPAPVDIVPPDLSAGGPSTIGTNFVSVGGGNYLNLQTGQTVPQSIAEEITGASTGAATANLQTVNTEGSITLIDPTSGQSSTVSTNNLSTAAAALAAAGKLVNAAGQLTAEGQSLLHSGNLYNPVQTTSSANVSAALANLGSWFTGSTMIPGIPNVAVVGVGVAAVLIVARIVTNPKPRKRK